MTMGSADAYAAFSKIQARTVSPGLMKWVTICKGTF